MIELRWYVRLALSALMLLQAVPAWGQSAPESTVVRPLCTRPLTASGACPRYDVALVQLLATPERYDGQRVRVIGFVHLEFEGDAVYAHRDDWASNLVFNRLAVEFRPGVVTASRPVSGRYVLLEGLFDMHVRGHMGLSSGTLKDISLAEPWPSRAELRRRQPRKVPELVLP